MAYRDSTTNSGSSATPSTAVPAGVVAGDIVILVAALDSPSAVFDTGDWPTGFTELREAVATGDGQTAAVGWKRLTGSDAGSYTFGNLAVSAEWVCQAFAFSGRHASDAPEASTNAIDNVANNSPVTVTANGVTAVLGDDLLWLSAPDVRATGVGTGHTAPGGYTEAEDAENNWVNLSGAYRENVAAGATGTVAGTFTHDNTSTAGWISWLVRIPVAAGAAANEGDVASRRGVRVLDRRATSRTMPRFAWMPLDVGPRVPTPFGPAPTPVLVLRRDTAFARLDLPGHLEYPAPPAADVVQYVPLLAQRNTRHTGRY